MAIQKNTPKSEALPALIKVKKPRNDIYVVGIGASAGGLDALQEFFDNIPTNTGMAFCVVQHLSPNFKSLMDELLSRHSRMKISTVIDGEKIEPNRIYLNSKEVSLKIKNGCFEYIEKETRGTLNLPIDMFFHSLGEEFQENAIGIILYGTGTDGSRGIRTIRDFGGTVMVQEPSSAQFDGMPNTAISTGFAEYIGTPTKLAQEIIKFPYKPTFFGNVNNGGTTTETEFIYIQILDELHKYCGVDFRLYKNNTLVKRLEKRMNLLDINELEDYLEFIKNNDEELEILKGDFFIGVTTFFRDKEAFITLKETVLPKLFKDRPTHEPIRLWSVGCSTGEEAYSLAILVDEYIKENRLKHNFKIFATDIDRKAIDIASNGQYIVNAVNDISQQRLEHYFIRTGEHYQIIKRIRKKIIFSTHNIIKDPPFIKMDFISCRNLLIYIQPKTQQKIFQHFQFSLNVFGFLFLGNSENLGDLQKDFEVLNNKWRIYINKTKTRVLPSFDQGDKMHQITTNNSNLHVTSKFQKQKSSPENVFTSQLAEIFAPKCIFIDNEYNILYIKGNFQDLIQIPQGIVQMNLMLLLDEKLAVMVRNGIRRLNEEKKSIVFTNVLYPQKNTQTKLNISFTRITKENNVMYLIAFDQKENRDAKTIVYDQYELDEFSKQRIDDLEIDLKTKQEELQYVVEELETSNEELQASNEELMASNEELQGTNEELQSVNEELYTVNTELQAKNKELQDLSNDINNLLISTDIGTLFLDNTLVIRKFTPALKKHFNLEDTDIGRPISNFTHKFPNRNDGEFIESIKTVISTQTAIELEIFDTDGNIYLNKILPYVTSKKSTDGVVITYVDITNTKQIEKDLRRSEEKHKNLHNELQVIIDNFPGLIFYKDSNNNYLKVNKLMADTYNLDKTEIEGKNLKTFYSAKQAKAFWEDDKAIMASGISKLNTIQSLETSEGLKWLNTSKILVKNLIDGSTNILGVSMEITELKKTEQLLEESLSKLVISNNELSQFAYVASHDLQEPLNNIVSFIKLFIEKYDSIVDDEGQQFLDIILNSSNRMKDLIKAVLEHSRLDNEVNTVSFTPLNTINQIITDMSALVKATNTTINIDSLPKKMKGQEINIRLLFQNLISNAIKFNSSKAPQIDISCQEKHGYYQFNVKDNGIGIDSAYAKKIFDVFQRLHNQDEYPGTGIGLANCKKIVEMHDGHIWFESEENKGTTFMFTISKT
ncbi:CheR family methyltransferase [Flavobacterium muglaense]|uniref:PAS domain-containing protein n=1 Tax=Flavobacterium muglaense TaxID=2764716 RepID=A0A923N3D3_9FLAO|nr:CheR family methyltransferase [Flavobacterium muglaense]MBC5838801.1 PAS domain-containing protein [Flavobacterium muglaense]MBC5845315.1 PAS domain-containing protein [Flavobacterium muglaense]